VSAGFSGGKAFVHNTITISDGISMGSEGMKYLLVSPKSSQTPLKQAKAAWLRARATAQSLKYHAGLNRRTWWVAVA